MLMNLVDNDMMRKFDRISDNDVNHAFSTLKSPQILSESPFKISETENSEKLMVENEKELSKNDENGDSVSTIDESLKEMTDAEFLQAIEDSKKEYNEMIAKCNDFPVMLTTNNGLKSNDKILEENKNLKTFPTPEMKTIVLLEPTSIKDGLFDPEDLKILMDLLSTAGSEKINTNFEVIYHDSIRSANLKNM